MRTRSDLEWLAFAVAAAVAAHFVAPGETPVDRSLPLLCILVAACGRIGGARLVQISVPMLLVAAMFLPDAQTRVFVYGIIVAGAFAWSARLPKIALLIPGVMLLRWIPLGDVVWWREIVVLVGAIAVGLGSAAARRRFEGAVAPAHSEGAILAALAIALVTPIFPGRMLLFPFVIAVLMLLPLPRIALAVAFASAAFFVRYSIATLCVAAAFAFFVVSAKEWKLLRVPIYACAIAVFALWPWSGIVARAMPRFLFAESASAGERPVWVALEPGKSVSIDAPPRAHRVVLTASGANASRFPAGRVVGREEIVEADGSVIRRDLRIGDIADFGFTRRRQFFASRNPIPRSPLDDVKGWGIAAWLHTAGRIAMFSPRPIASVRITAAPGLPPATKLQVESIEFE